MGLNKILMIENIIKELFRINSCTYFVLPLLKINTNYFINEVNFIDSFLSYDQKFILVQVHDIEFFEHVLKRHPYYRGIYMDKTHKYFVLYKIPSMFKEDVKLYCHGYFGEMSDKAKKFVKRYSGLTYNDYTPTGIFTDIRIRILERDFAARRLWELYLNLDKKLPENMDLLERPGGKIYMDITTLQSI